MLMGSGMGMGGVAFVPLFPAFVGLMLDRSRSLGVGTQLPKVPEIDEVGRQAG